MILERRLMYVARQIQDEPPQIPWPRRNPTPEEIARTRDSFGEEMAELLYNSAPPLFPEDRLNRFAQLAGQLLGEIPAGKGMTSFAKLLRGIEEGYRFDLGVKLAVEAARIHQKDYVPGEMLERLQEAVTQMHKPVHIH